MWFARVEQAKAFVDPATESWGLAFTRHVNGELSAELIGPRLKPMRLDTGIVGTEYWGVEFQRHVAIRAVNKRDILDVFERLPISDGSFTLGAEQYPIPEYEKLDVFVAELEWRQAIVMHARVAQALAGNLTGYSERSWQRHVTKTTGLTRKQIEQLERVRYAYHLIRDGHSIAAAAVQAGYADQPHLTRAFRLLRAESPAQVLARPR